ncbi:MAG: hypothetical protein ABIJ91_01490 [Candidatus Kuenenbacteria bacterium]
MQKKQNNKTKMYSAIVLVMVIIITAWVLNFKNSFNKNQSTNPDNQELQQLSSEFNRILINIKKFKEQLSQSPTTTAEQLQGGPQISPAQLNKIIEELDNIELASTTTSTLPSL